MQLRTRKHVSSVDERYQGLTAEAAEAEHAWTQKRDAETEASTRARAAAATLETAELDDLIGRCPAERLEAARTAAGAAQAGLARAATDARQAEQRYRQLSEALARFEPERVAAKVQEYHARTRVHVQRLLTLLGEAAEVSEAIHAIFAEAETEFPQFYLPFYRDGTPRPYPVAADLVDLSWEELRHHPSAANDGRFATWRNAAIEFLQQKGQTA